jgi:hypothetical protein
MKATGPLTAAEKPVFGEHAVREPVTGDIIETGIGSAHHEARIEREAALRGTPSAPHPAPLPSQPEPRTIDLRAVHSFPDACSDGSDLMLRAGATDRTGELGSLINVARPRGYFIRPIGDGSFRVEGGRSGGGKSRFRGTAAEVHRWLCERPMMRKEKCGARQ